MGWIKDRYKDIEDSVKKGLDEIVEAYGGTTREDLQRNAQRMQQQAREQAEADAADELAREQGKLKHRDRRPSTLLTQRQPLASAKTLLTGISSRGAPLGSYSAFGASAPLSSGGMLGG